MLAGMVHLWRYSEVGVVNKTIQPVVITPPKKLRAAVGEEAANEIVQMVVQIVASTASDKVSKNEYDSHAAYDIRLRLKM